MLDAFAAACPIQFQPLPHLSTHTSPFYVQNIANTLWALVYMHHRSEPLLRAAAAAAAAKAQDFKPQELANLVGGRGLHRVPAACGRWGLCCTAAATLRIILNRLPAAHRL